VIAQWVQRGVGSVLAIAGHITVIFFPIFFLLISGSHFRKRNRDRGASPGRTAHCRNDHRRYHGQIQAVH
jgi:hypothetical protein